MTNEQTDPVVERVRAKLLARSQVGIAKYGTTLARTDLSQREWLQHLQHELLDGANYCERAMQDAAEFSAGDTATASADGFRAGAAHAAQLAEALREAMHWNWLDDDARPSDRAALCDAALAAYDAAPASCPDSAAGIPATERNQEVAEPAQVSSEAIKLLRALQSHLGPRRPSDDDEAEAWDQIDAAIAALQQSSGWQPIETAPADRKTYVIIFDGNHVRMARRYGSGGRYRTAGGAYTIATHWMPLPNPPQVQP